MKTEGSMKRRHRRTASRSSRVKRIAGFDAETDSPLPCPRAEITADLSRNIASTGPSSWRSLRARPPRPVRVFLHARPALQPVTVGLRVTSTLLLREITEKGAELPALSESLEQARRRGDPQGSSQRPLSPIAELETSAMPTIVAVLRDTPDRLGRANITGSDEFSAHTPTVWPPSASSDIIRCKQSRYPMAHGPSFLRRIAPSIFA